MSNHNPNLTYPPDPSPSSTPRKTIDHPRHTYPPSPRITGLPTEELSAHRPDLFHFLIEHDLRRLLDYYGAEAVFHALIEIAHLKAEYYNRRTWDIQAAWWVDLGTELMKCEELARAVDIEEEVGSGSSDQLHRGVARQLVVEK